jgi:hypothetical protein
VTTPKRDSFVEVSTATREMIERANAIPLNARQWRVLSAVVYFVPLYSRLSDRVSIRQVAIVAGFGSDDEMPGWARDRVGKTLRELVEFGLITYTPGKGQRSSPVVGIIGNTSQSGSCTTTANAAGSHVNTSNGTPTTRARSARVQAVNTSKYGTRTRASVRGTPRKTRTKSEEVSEERSAASPSAGAPGASPPAGDVDQERAAAAMERHFPELWDMLPKELADMTLDEVQLVEKIAKRQLPTSALDEISR